MAKKLVINVQPFVLEQKICLWDEEAECLKEIGKSTIENLGGNLSKLCKQTDTSAIHFIGNIDYISNFIFEMTTNYDFSNISFEVTEDL